MCPLLTSNRAMGLRLGLLGSVLGALLTLGCASPLPTERQETDPDRIMEAQVKVALIDTLDVTAAALQAQAEAGVVTLSGFVETEAERERALAVTREVPDMRRVIDNIEVK